MSSGQRPSGPRIALAARESARWPRGLPIAFALGILGALGAPFALAGAASAATSAPRPLLAAARLSGSFLLAGRVKVASNVRGERAGQRVSRTWTFTSTCPARACSTVRLVRRRSHGRDRVLLRRRAPGYYTGTGSFSAPLRCGNRTYRGGQLVPFSTTVRITGARLFAGAILATRLDATYVNRTRANRTPCFALLGHDSARYHGHLILGPPSAGAGTHGASGS